jgi:2,3-dihydroxyphenylpropionate 1,2-dioxygenase
VGAHEVRTWIAAVAARNTPIEVIVYEPVREWITGMGAVASR